MALLLMSSACAGEADDDPTGPSFVPVPSTAEPEPSDPPSADPSPDATATAEALVAPELPAVATEETPEGAAAFAEWWFETLNYATATGDTAELRNTFVETCGTCESFATQIESAYGAGGAIDGGRIDVEVDRPPALEEDGVALAMQVDASAGEVLDQNGGVITVLEGEQLASVMAVLFIDSEWVVGGIQ
ncbi:DUF6318 family protein [Aquipuribacter sp. MA13-6]|uniref:DUF6318 family protein n=1 Tax=unclassified Aquipuribacter TaxID=2635084 RepID=UPI003EF05481